jgi:hypothetical protein
MSKLIVQFVLMNELSVPELYLAKKERDLQLLDIPYRSTWHGRFVSYTFPHRNTAACQASQEFPHAQP